jgi:hypothetical protein
MMRQFPALLAVASVLLLPCLAWAAPLLDDHFGDGNLATNSLGVGTGFSVVKIGGNDVSEGESKVSFNLLPASLHGIQSNDNLNLFTAAGTSTAIQVSGMSSAGNVPLDYPAGDNCRVWFGLVTETAPTSWYALPVYYGTPIPQSHGLWVSLYDTIDGAPFNQATLGGGTNPNNHNGQLGWIDSSGNPAILAQFTYNTYVGQDPAHNAIDIVMNVTDTTYAVSFGGPDSGVTVQNGALSGNLPSAPVGNFRVAATIQSGGRVGGGPTDGITMDIDRITINPAAPPAHPGDFDSDGDVDGADFVAWQTNFPKATGAVLSEGDADADGDVDGADFVVWQTNFPFTPAPGASPVPEPNSIALLSLATVIALAFRRGGRK